jgi:hypothetical protein
MERAETEGKEITELQRKLYTRRTGRIICESEKLTKMKIRKALRAWKV